ncbi:thermonuclease family protein [Klebsiella pneumoniae]|uniref:thermonuclease family protein n=1 Tax=Klebsiella pneumoniae TaxID=573 RepID=UPI000A4A2BCC|nr:thermonuclease family protein [Klebsiella pneumoniae]
MVAQRHVSVTGSDKDRYGRLLGTLWLGVTAVNAEQIRKGLAWTYRYHGKPARPDYAVLELKPAVSQSDSGQNQVRQSPGAGVVCIRMGLKRIMIKEISE